MLHKYTMLAAILSLAGTLQAAYIGYLYPAGGKAGEEVEILVTSSNCSGVVSLSLLYQG